MTDTSSSKSSNISGGSVSNSNKAARSSSEGESVPFNPQAIAWLERIKAQFSVKDQPDLRAALLDAVDEKTPQTDDDFTVSERTMLANILRFGALRVDDVMVPRADIQAVDEGASLGELLQTFSSAGHSRVPLYRESLDDPVGMVHVKDMMGLIADVSSKQLATKPNKKQKKAKAEDSKLTDAVEPTEQVPSINHNMTAGIDFTTLIKEAGISRPVLFVPPSMPVVNLLLRMQSTRVHMALVVDEYGGTDGLVTIENLIEEVVGDIEDEHDDQTVSKLTGDIASGLHVSARIDLEDLEAKLGMSLALEEDHDDVDTLGGLVVAFVGRVPVRGEVVTHPAGVEIEILDADPRRIKLLKLTRTD